MMNTLKNLNVVLSGFKDDNRLGIFLNKLGINVKEVVDNNTNIVIAIREKTITTSSSKIKLALQKKIPIIYYN